MAYFEPLKTNYRLLSRLLTLHCFILTLYNYIFSFCVFCFFFDFVFLSLLATPLGKITSRGRHEDVPKRCPMDVPIRSSM